MSDAAMSDTTAAAAAGIASTTEASMSNDVNATAASSSSSSSQLQRPQSSGHNTRKRKQPKNTTQPSSQQSQESLLSIHPLHLCKYFIKHKHRYCVFVIAKGGKEYCAHHAVYEMKQAGDESENMNTVAPGGSGESTATNAPPHTIKIPCSYCRAPIKLAYAPSTGTAPSAPSTVRGTPMEAHLQVCPKRKVEEEATKLVFYEKNVNGVWRTMGGGEGSSTDALSSSTSSTSTTTTPFTLSSIPSSTLLSLITRLRSIAQSKFGIDESYVQRQDAEYARYMQQKFESGEVKESETFKREFFRSTEKKEQGSGGELAGLSSSSSSSLSSASRVRHALQHYGFFDMMRNAVKKGDSSDITTSSISTAPPLNLLPRGSIVIEVGAGKAGLAGYLAEEVQQEYETMHLKEGKASGEEHSERKKEHAGTNKRRKLGVQVGNANSAPATAVTSSTHASAVPHSSTSSSHNYTLLVLDRGSFKHKTDVSIRRSGLCTFKRYRCDLQDVRLEKMEELAVNPVLRHEGHYSDDPNSPNSTTISSSTATVEASDTTPPSVVVIGKHVCGQATDFVCRAVVRANKNAREAAAVGGASTTSIATDMPASSPPSTNPCLLPSLSSLTSPPLPSHFITTVCIATCCHHLCIWENYCAQDWFLSLGLTKEDFQIMTRMSTWWTCGFGEHGGGSSGGEEGEKMNKEGEMNVRVEQNEDQEMKDSDATSTTAASSSTATSSSSSHPSLNLTTREREFFGYVCKYLFDAGRIAYLHTAAHFTRVAERRVYTTSEITKEHACIVLA